MDIKEFLSQLFEMEKIITSKLIHIQMLRDNAVSTSSGEFTAKSTSVSDIVGKSVSAIVALEESIKNDTICYKKAEEEILTVINKVSNYRLRSLLSFRYIELRSWVEIAQLMGMSNYHVSTRMHNKAIAEAEKYWSNS